MSTEQEDLQLHIDTLESWAAIVPPEAEAFHRRVKELLQEVRTVTGSFSRDPAAVAAVRAQFQDLAQLLPGVRALIELTGRVRVRVAELRGQAPSTGPVHTVVQDVTGSWLALMDFLVRSVSDSNKVRNAMYQVGRIEEWVEERKDALDLLSLAGTLEAAVRNPEHKKEIKAAVVQWTKAFGEGRVNDEWRAEAERTSRRFARFRDEEAKIESLAREKPEASQTAAAGPVQAVVADPPAEVDTARLHFFRIDQALAECRDLAAALEYQGSDINEFTSRHWQLRNRSDAPLSDLQGMQDDVEAFRKMLLQRADAESSRRLRRLRLRWQWFESVYDTRPEIAQMLTQAEAEIPNVAHRLNELFQIIEQAEHRIYSVVEGNRPKLRRYVGEQADRCRARIAGLRQVARSIAVDAALARVETEVPEEVDQQLAARALFDRLETCHRLAEEIATLEAQNKTSHHEVMQSAARLTALVTELAALSDAAEVAELAAAIPRELSPERRLDDIAADLVRIDAQVEARRGELLRATTTMLLSVRKENVGWIRALVDFAPEVEQLMAKDPPSRDLEGARRDLEGERRASGKIAEISVVAGRRLSVRREDSTRHLQAYLDSPAFETHPERESAQALVRRLTELPALLDPPLRNAFVELYEVVAETEGFADRIESARRAIPQRLEKLEERFRQLRERNGIVYRPDLAQRGNMLLQGVHRAIQHEQWEPLTFQLTQADTLLSALERDALAQITAETEELVDTLKSAAKRSTDQIYVRQIESALHELEEDWTLEPPPFALRRRLSRLAGRSAAPPERSSIS